MNIIIWTGPGFYSAHSNPLKGGLAVWFLDNTDEDREWFDAVPEGWIAEESQTRARR